jgi:hypothetical protein
MRKNSSLFLNRPEGHNPSMGGLSRPLSPEERNKEVEQVKKFSLLSDGWTFTRLNLEGDELGRYKVISRDGNKFEIQRVNAPETDGTASLFLNYKLAKDIEPPVN